MREPKCDNCLTGQATALVFIPTALRSGISENLTAPVGKAKLCQKCLDRAKIKFGNPATNEAIYNLGKMRLWDMPKPKIIDPNFRIGKVLSTAEIMAANRAKNITVIKPPKEGKIKAVGKFRLIEVI